MNIIYEKKEKKPTTIGDLSIGQVFIFIDEAGFENRPAMYTGFENIVFLDTGEEYDCECFEKYYDIKVEILNTSLVIHD